MLVLFVLGSPLPQSDPSLPPHATPPLPPPCGASQNTDLSQHQEKPIYLGKYGPTIFGLLVHRKAIAGLQALTKAADITIHFQVNEMPSEWHGMVTMA